MLIRSGMVRGYWRVGRDIGGSGEKWWDYCIFCFSQQTALAQAVTGVFSTRGCPHPQASTHPNPPLAFRPTHHSCLSTTCLLHSRYVEPISYQYIKWVKLALAVWQDTFLVAATFSRETCNHLNASKAKFSWWTFAEKTVCKLAEDEKESTIMLKMWTSWDQKRPTLGCSASFHFHWNLFQIYPQALLSKVAAPLKLILSL